MDHTNRLKIVCKCGTVLGESIDGKLLVPVNGYDIELNQYPGLNQIEIENGCDYCKDEDTKEVIEEECKNCSYKKEFEDLEEENSRLRKEVEYLEERIEGEAINRCNTVAEYLNNFATQVSVLLQLFSTTCVIEYEDFIKKIKHLRIQINLIRGQLMKVGVEKEKIVEKQDVNM